MLGRVVSFVLEPPSSRLLTLTRAAAEAAAAQIQSAIEEAVEVQPHG